MTLSLRCVKKLVSIALYIYMYIRYSIDKCKDKHINSLNILSSTHSAALNARKEEGRKKKRKKGEKTCEILDPHTSLYITGGTEFKTLATSLGAIWLLCKLLTWLPFLRRCRPIFSFQLSDSSIKKT